MKFSDFIIIYLACGAPFGVYYFFQNRKTIQQKRLTLNSFLTMTVWIPYAFRLLKEFIAGKLAARELSRIYEADAAKKNKLDHIEKEIAQILLAENSSVPLFDFRETFQRYAGLTLALQNTNEIETASENEKELFRVAGNENVELGAKCLQRRNLNRLKFHQNLSRADVVEMFGAINAEINESDIFKTSVTNFFKLLNDDAAENALGEIFGLPSQTAGDFRVRNTEKDLWRAREDKRQSTSQTALNLQTMSQAAATTTRKRE